MKYLKCILLSGSAVALAVCAVFASTLVSNQKAWYNAAEFPALDPPVPVFTTITHPFNTSAPVLECSKVVESKICTINSRQAFYDRLLTEPLYRGF